MIKRWCWFPCLAIEMIASLRTKDTTLPTTEPTTSGLPTYRRRPNRTLILVVVINLSLEQIIGFAIYFLQFVGNVITIIRDDTTKVTHVSITERTIRRTGDPARWFAAHIPLRSTTGFRDVVFPILQTTLDIVGCYRTTLKVGLQTYTCRRSHFVRTGQSVITIRTTHHITGPFITPPSSTIGEHAIPQGAVALASLACHHTTIEWPCAA